MSKNSNTLKPADKVNLRIVVHGPTRSGKGWLKIAIANALMQHGIGVVVEEAEMKTERVCARATKLCSEKLSDIVPHLGEVHIGERQAPRSTAVESVFVDPGSMVVKKVPFSSLVDNEG